MTIGKIIFALILLGALAFFARSAKRLVRWARIAKRPDNRTNEPVTRTRNLLMIGILQAKILRDPIGGMMHALVFWGFVVLGAGTVEIIIQGLVTGFTWAWILPKFLYLPYVVSQEFFAVFVLGAVVWLLYRRLITRPRRFHNDPVHGGDAVFILSMIGVLMVTLLIVFTMEMQAGAPATGRWISSLFLPLVSGVTPGTAHVIAQVNWWIHAVLILFFLNYLPYSKHLHVLTSLINVWTSNTSGPGRIGAMVPMDLEAEDAEQFGASDVEHLSWKNLLDSYSCTECGRCTAACPANLTGKLLSPRMIVVKTRGRLTEKATVLDAIGDNEPTEEQSGVLAKTLLDEWITEEELWACTSCRACVVECPVSIDQLEIIDELRRDLVLMESRFPDELQPAMTSMERYGSPWAFAPEERASWAEGMNIRTVAEMEAAGERPDILFWVGCMGSFDDRAKKITVAFARILQAANVNFAILGQEERCHGDPARRMGNEYLYQVLAKQAIETLNSHEIRTIVTFCPHCFHQILNEFPDLGGHFEAIHHTTYIERLMAEGKVPLDTEEGKQLTIAYHDPCYLGRYNNVYDAPRNVLSRTLPIMQMVEAPRNRDKSFCCGAGGGRMFMEEDKGKRINVERSEELLATGADQIALSCPFCMTMISDGVASVGGNAEVLDVAEIVASRLRQPAAAS